jgi:hypothetical protein
MTLKTMILSDLEKYWGLHKELRLFLNSHLSFEESRNIILERVRDRQINFLNLVKHSIYGNGNSPYLKLLKMAGCKFGDFKDLVTQNGIELALLKLLKDGVYLSWEEFKGKKEIVRGSTHFLVGEAEFENTLLPAYLHIRSSGSRGAGSRTQFDLQHRLYLSNYRAILLRVWNAADYPIGLWQASLPSVAGIGPLLAYAAIGKPVAKWFSPVTEAETKASIRDKIATRYIIYGSWLWGTKLLNPEHVPLDRAFKIAEWMSSIKQKHGSCSLESFVSPAVKVSQAAFQNGIDLSGTKFFVGGEPLTEAKRHYFDKIGAQVVPRYFMTETGPIGFGCPNNSTASCDAVHLFSDSLTIIQRERRVDPYDISVNAFLITTLHSCCPKILFNVETDDYGVLETKECDCLFGRLGYNRHVHSIRSFSKLTTSGMTILGTDMVYIIENILPQKFGGNATDYQVREEENEKGETRLNLVINPNIAGINDEDVKKTVINHLQKKISGGSLASGFWGKINTIQVIREYPATLKGKVLTLDIFQQGKSERDS